MQMPRPPRNVSIYVRETEDDGDQIVLEIETDEEGVFDEPRHIKIEVGPEYEKHVQPCGRGDKNYIEIMLPAYTPEKTMQAMLRVLRYLQR
jgi:hypothetical protein